MIARQCAKTLKSRLVHRYASCSIGSRPFSASADDLVLTEMNEETGIGILSMNNAPANSLSMEMVSAMSNGIKEMEANPKITAMILSSTRPNIYSAGLDFKEIHKPEAEQLAKYFDNFQQLFLDLYGSRLTTFAAMGGHAPAAGCMLALSCDYRIFSSVGKIGLNESQLGIIVPEWLGQQMVDAMGPRQAEKALFLGTLFSADEALSLGLVDEVVEGGDQDSVVEIAKERAAKWIAIPAQAREGVKQYTRSKPIQTFLANRQATCDKFCSNVLSEDAQANMSAYLEALANRKKK